MNLEYAKTFCKQPKSVYIAVWNMNSAGGMTKTLSGNLGRNKTVQMNTSYISYGSRDFTESRTICRITSFQKRAGKRETFYIATED